MNEIKEIVVYPASTNDLESLPLLADIQFLETYTSQSLNRKFLGIIPKGIYRGFNVSIKNNNTLTVECKENSTAAVERDGYLLTILGQHNVDLSVQDDVETVVVIEAQYKYGQVTKQVDSSSNIDAATLKAIPKTDLEYHHIVICTVTKPKGIALVADHISYDDRTLGGIYRCYNREESDERYIYKVDGDIGAAQLPVGDTNQRPTKNANAGLSRFNSELGLIEYFDGHRWKAITSNATGGNVDNPSIWYKEFTNAKDQTVFPIERPVNAFIEVNLNGFELAKSDYKIYGDNVILDEPIKANSDLLSLTIFSVQNTHISQEEYTDKQGETVFPLAHKPNDYVKVVLNGFRLAQQDFELVAGGVNIKTPLKHATDVLVLTALTQQIIDGGHYG